ncbi:hypothetical protein TRIP_E110127 [uncultured Spirochaetota bacterium]|uniref:Uncharacterized protein n=1 Tax=uncultured Spirochaetota bacterium TaxID=460511 RepID=A0A652ZSA9_9SPIR|nr:hypothetical protein TRIP_E110127 [uncultured Spirochaetota bacterium]
MRSFRGTCTRAPPACAAGGAKCPRKTELSPRAAGLFQAPARGRKRRVEQRIFPRGKGTPKSFSAFRKRPRRREYPDALFDLDSSTGVFDLLLDLGGLFLGDILLKGLVAGLDQVLGLLEPQAGDRPDFLDDGDLFVGGNAGFQNDGELGLLLGGSGRGCGGTGGDGHGGRGGYAELLFHCLHEIGDLENRHRSDRVDDLIFAERCHIIFSSFTTLAAHTGNLFRKTDRNGSNPKPDGPQTNPTPARCLELGRAGLEQLLQTLPAEFPHCKNSAKPSNNNARLLLSVTPPKLFSPR